MCIQGRHWDIQQCLEYGIAHVDWSFREDMAFTYLTLNNADCVFGVGTMTNYEGRQKREPEHSLKKIFNVEVIYFTSLFY